MAKQEELDIEITPDGQVHVHVKGMPGKRCLDYVEVFQQLLGPVQSEVLTDEYYDESSIASVDHVKQRSRIDW